MASCGDDGAILYLNESMGYYRAAGRYEECSLCTRQAMDLVDELAYGTMQYGTMLSKRRDGIPCRGKYQRRETPRTGIRNLPEVYYMPDYHMASLHNNLSLLYSETGRLRGENGAGAGTEIVRKLDDADVEVASSPRT